MELVGIEPLVSNEIKYIQSILRTLLTELLYIHNVLKQDAICNPVEDVHTILLFKLVSYCGFVIWGWTRFT